MNLIIKLREKGKVNIEQMIFENFRGDERIVVTADFITTEENNVILSNVYFNDKLANENGAILKELLLRNINAFDNNGIPLSWLEIEEITVQDYFYNNGKVIENKFNLSQGCFSDFILYRIEGIDKEFNRKEYSTLWRHFMKERQKSNAINALGNMNDIPQNVYNYLIETDLENFADKLDEDTLCTGEYEMNAIDNYIEENCSGIVYPVFISNKGTEDEQADIVPLLKVHLSKIEENMMEFWNGSPSPKEIGTEWPEIFDIYEENISLEYVDEIIEDYLIFLTKLDETCVYFLTNASAVDVLAAKEHMISNNRDIFEMKNFLNKKGFFVSIENTYIDNFINMDNKISGSI